MDDIKIYLTIIDPEEIAAAQAAANPVKGGKKK
jgi:hypothetical protein